MIFNICLLFMPVSQKRYIHLFKKKGETSSWIKMRFSVTTRGEEGENGGGDAVEGHGEEAVSMAAVKAFGLSALQHTR